MKFRKGELKFYKDSTPKELKDYIRANKDCKEYIEHFMELYTYNYVKKFWEKKNKSLLDRLKRDS